MRNGLKTPVFKEKEAFFSVEIYRQSSDKVAVSSDKVAISSDKVAISSDKIELTKNEKFILDYIYKNEKITNEEARKITGLKSAGVRKIFHKLVEKNYIAPIGKGKGRYYVKSELGIDN